jgi:hypothetical protein
MLRLGGGSFLMVAALLIMLLALLGALLSPFALFIDALPGDTSGFLAHLNTAKVYITDFLLWFFLSLAALMCVIILDARRRPRRGMAQIGLTARPSLRLPADLGPTKVAVAITAYNDAKATEQAVRDFKAQPDVVEVIVIDNNSRDETAALAAAAGARVVRETRQGYGYACIRGLHEALNVPGAETIILTEGDGTFVASDLAKFQAYIHQADLVVGTRVVPGLVEEGSQMDHFFIWGNIFASALLRLKFWDLQFLGAVRLSDLGCTYRAIRREALEKIVDQLRVGGNHFSPDMIMAALANGLSIVEIPVNFRRRIGKSKGASQSLWQGLRVGIAMIWHILTYRPRGPEIVDIEPGVGEHGVV